ncbi:hypothetical protein B0H34DRAFT_792372 [Crassisporium funariophilum]|nr:hypothetical protein B0H34DRAFT_792372 [Crassisporium funariophilum]
MPAAAIDEPPTRTWWSLAKPAIPPNHKDFRMGYGPEKSARRPPPPVKTSAFNSFASAFGLKSKKHPSLAIQDPPSPAYPTINTPPPTSPPPSAKLTSNRPTSKAASSTRSRVDSIEPRTPVDYQRDKRHSLLTLSDTDPFAGRPVVTVPVPHLPSDHSHLSAYLNPSVTEFHQKVEQSPFNRVSYASSSSLSNNHSGDVALVSAPLKSLNEPRRLLNKRSTGSMNVKRSPGSADPLFRQASFSPSAVSISKSGSSSTLVDQPRSPPPDGKLPRPKMRARGMTDGGTSSQKAGFFVDRKLSQKPSLSNFFPACTTSKDAPELSPRVIIRQASVTRLYTPPTAPPTHSLPPPPQSVVEVKPHPRRADVPSRTESASSSSLSFSSSLSATIDMFSSPLPPLRDLDKRSSDRSMFSQNTTEHDFDVSYGSATSKESRTAPSSPRTLKKALSHQSLRRTNPAPPPSLPKSPPEHTFDRVFRKQRSFHHTRLPVPPVPLPTRPPGSANSATFPALAEFGTQTTSEQRRGSTASSMGRKRLFSNSSNNRPSTSQCIPSSAGEDSQSVFSVRSDHDSYFAPFKPWTASRASSQSSSFWDEGASEEVPISPIRSTNKIEYTPQPILTAAEVAKLEASVENSPDRATRSRGFSLLSASTAMSDLDDVDFIPAGLSPPPAARPYNKQHASSQTKSYLSSKYQVVPTSATPFPSVHSHSNSPPSSPHLSARSEDDSHRSSNRTSGKALPSSASQVTVRPSSSPTLLMNSLPPPPRIRQRQMLMSQPDRPSTAPSRPPSVRKPTRSKSTVEKNMHRRSILKKPSFLDIDDDTDKDSDVDFSGEPITESFLDLARESFDTGRSDL